MMYEMVMGSDRPSQATTRAAAVGDELRRLIRSGELAPGTRLRQTDIAARFAVSTTPVREAFMSLAREGLVRQDAHRGVVVFIPSRDDLVQNYEIRLALEPLGARLAAENATDEEIAALIALQADMREALYSDVPRFGSELNARFHTMLYRAAKRPRLAALIEQLRDASAAYIQLLALTPQPLHYLDAAQAEHEEIVAAVAAREHIRAADAMARHLIHNRDQILASLAAPPPDARGDAAA
jgi:DNA-binding GntR family transcriptional regulator